MTSTTTAPRRRQDRVPFTAHRKAPGAPQRTGEATGSDDGASERCPAYRLAIEHLRLIAAYDVVDLANRQGRSANRAATDGLHFAAAAVRDHAGVVAANSIGGALFQLGVVADMLDTIEGNTEDEFRRELYMAQCALFSVGGVLRRLMEPDDPALAAADYFLSEGVSPRRWIDRARRGEPVLDAPEPPIEPVQN
jgi:hypothetical protein